MQPMNPDQMAADYLPGQIGNGKTVGVEFTFPLRARPRRGRSSFPAALVASSDENLLREISELVLQSGLRACLAFTVCECKRVLQRQTVALVVCDDRLIDGKYEDILSEIARLQLATPVIVVSPTGNWPDYLKAMSLGAFDYLGYPPIPGDLPRTLYAALTTLTGRDYRSGNGRFFFAKGGLR